jgi:hypothetical protein
MATTNIVFGAATALTVTNLHSLASSTTAGWQSDVVTNTGTLALDALVMVVLDFANTAPANDKTAYVYAYGGVETGVYTNPCTGTQGTLTLTDITANATAIKLIGTVPYTTQDEVAEAGPFSVALAFGGVLPPFFGIAIMNYSGAALAASGNTVKYTLITSTTA